jgi:transposase
METIIEYLEKQFTKSRVMVLICLILMAFEYTNSEIKDRLGVSYPTLRKYRAALEKKEIEPLFSNGGNRRKGRLDEHSDEIASDFTNQPPATLREAKERVKKLTGKTLSLNRLRKKKKKRA